MLRSFSSFDEWQEKLRAKPKHDLQVHQNSWKKRPRPLFIFSKTEGHRTEGEEGIGRADSVKDQRHPSGRKEDKKNRMTLKTKTGLCGQKKERRGGEKRIEREGGFVI